MTLLSADPLDALVLALAGAADASDRDLLGDLPARLVHLERLPARSPTYAELARPLPPAVQERIGVRLWAHQAAAIDLARDRRSVAIATGTASGKSLAFQAPIAEAVSAPIRPGTALLLFPTKALAHDQLRSLVEPGFANLVAGAYDGDAGPEERTWIRRHANVVLTNPEMLHHGLLPHHARWSTFLGRLRYVVIDELHVFRGIFGTHVAQLLRRLRRLCQRYGSDPTFIFCSATIGHPERLASGLCGSEVTAVTDDGSPRGERFVALWNPPLVDELRGVRASAHGETAGLLASLVGRGHRSIAFCRSRRGTEVVAADAKRRLPPGLADLVRPYRGGYLAEERREIEDELFSGRLAGVVATTALELGIDIGGLDAVVLDGFPGTISSFWQQAGRAGREQQQSLAVLVAGQDQLDQWLMAHPAEVFSRCPEPAVINPGNPFVLDPHLRCAAFEQPLTHADEKWWPGLLDDGVRRLALADELAVRPRGARSEPTAVWSGTGWPTHGVGLRSGSSGEVRIVAGGDGRIIGTVDWGRAFEHVHPGAFYLHQGEGWRVVDLDLDHGVATVEPDAGAEYTLVRSDTQIRLVGVDAVRSIGRVSLHLGPVEVDSQVTGFQRKDRLTGEVLGTHELELPATTLPTRAFWYTIGVDVLVAAGIDSMSGPGALHAAEHAGIGVLPLFTICDRWDVGGVSTMLQAEAGAPAIVVYDGYPGGAGIAELGFEAGDRHLAATLESIEACGCQAGCPSCVQSPKCGNGNEPLDKVAAAALLRTILG
jgi:DEAD/DEAH box helicase domain-containing protein